LVGTHGAEGIALTLGARDGLGLLLGSLLTLGADVTTTPDGSELILAALLTLGAGVGPELVLGWLLAVGAAVASKTDDSELMLGPDDTEGAGVAMIALDVAISVGAAVIFGSADSEGSRLMLGSLLRVSAWVGPRLISTEGAPLRLG
jgi:hypothetical protein